MNRESKQNNSNNDNDNIISPSNLNHEQFSITPLKLKNDKKVSYFVQNGSPIYAETPWVRAPFGISGFQPKGSLSLEWSINLSAVGDDSSIDEKEKAETNAWFEQWVHADEMMIDHGVANSKLIFGKEYKPSQRDVVAALFAPVVKGKDTAYPIRVQPKIMKMTKQDPNDKAKFITLHDEPNILVCMEGSAEELTITSFKQLEKLVPKNGYVKAIVQPKTWYVAGKFGLLLNVLQLLVRKKTGGRPTGYAFGVPLVPASTSAPTLKVKDSTDKTEDNNHEEQVDSDEEQGEEVVEEE